MNAAGIGIKQLRQIFQPPINQKKHTKAIKTTTNQTRNQATLDKFIKKTKKPEPNQSVHHPSPKTTTNPMGNHETKPPYTNLEYNQEIGTKPKHKLTPPSVEHKPVLRQPTLKLQPKTSKPETKNTTANTNEDKNQQQQLPSNSKVTPVFRKPKLTIPEPENTEKTEPVTKTNPAEYNPTPPKPKNVSRQRKDYSLVWTLIIGQYYTRIVVLTNNVNRCNLFLTFN